MPVNESPEGHRLIRLIRGRCPLSFVRELWLVPKLSFRDGLFEPISKVRPPTRFARDRRDRRSEATCSALRFCARWRTPARDLLAILLSERRLGTCLGGRRIRAAIGFVFEPKGPHDDFGIFADRAHDLGFAIESFTHAHLRRLGVTVVADEHFGFPVAT